VHLNRRQDLPPEHQAVEVWHASGEFQRLKGLTAMGAGPKFAGLQLRLEEI